jgi:hypothetical protein
VAKKSAVLAKAAAAQAAKPVKVDWEAKPHPAVQQVLPASIVGERSALIQTLPAAPKTRLRRKVNRREFNFAVFVGSSIAPKAWCKTREEVSAFIQTVPSKKLDAIDVATLTPVKTAVTVNF